MRGKKPSPTAIMSIPMNFLVGALHHYESYRGFISLPDTQREIQSLHPFLDETLCLSTASQSTGKCDSFN
jgi:hypothetical protein